MKAIWNQTHRFNIASDLNYNLYSLIMLTEVREYRKIEGSPWRLEDYAAQSCHIIIAASLTYKIIPKPK